MRAHRSALASARRAAGHTQESLAAALSVDRSTVIRWEAGDHAPLPYLRPKLARLVGCSQDGLREIIDGVSNTELNGIEVAMPANTGVNLGWLDQWAGWVPGTARRKLAGQVSVAGAREAVSHHKPRVGRSRLAETLSTYYPDRSDGLGLYEASCGAGQVKTSILTRDAWLDLHCHLPGQERMALALPRVEGDPGDVAGPVAEHADHRDVPR